MDDIWIIDWLNHTAFDANPMWKSLKKRLSTGSLRRRFDYGFSQIFPKFRSDVVPISFQLPSVYFIVLIRNTDPFGGRHIGAPPKAAPVFLIN